MGKDPTRGQDVGGASFALCHVTEEAIDFVFGGDCFILVGTEKGDATGRKLFFFTGFGQAAFEVEKKDQDAYTSWLKKTKGNKGKAWNRYRPYYEKKRIRCANKNLDKGGYATLNGDPALEKYWLTACIRLSLSLKFILLATDGLLPPSKTNPKDRNQLTRKLARLYQKGGVGAIYKWRDSVERRKRELTHIEGHPEAAAAVLRW
jgi:hypothetical protein